MCDEQIKQEIQTISSELSYDIIAARDIGSNAWGLSSEDSDHDIRLIFRESYDPNKIGMKTGSISLPETSDDLDLSTWSLNKFAELLNKSNPSALKFASSNIQYIEESDNFQNLCEYGLNNFNPASAIGAFRGTAKSNYQKYLKPTIIHEHGENDRGFTTTKYETDAEGFLHLEPIDNPDAEERRIHASRLGDSNWKIIHREKNRNIWEIIEPEWNKPEDLYRANEITIERDGEQKTLKTEEIGEEGDKSSEFRWSTADCTIKRYIYIARDLMMADIIANTQTYPNPEFEETMDAYNALSENKRYTDLDTDLLLEYANKKRDGRGSEKTTIPNRDALENSIESLLQAFQDGANHQGDIDPEKLNEFIEG